MSPALRDEVLGLPRDERAVLAVEILASLEDAPLDDPAEVDRAWGEVMLERSTEIRSGSVDTVSWDDLKQQMEANRRRL